VTVDVGELVLVAVSVGVILGVGLSVIVGVSDGSGVSEGSGVFVATVGMFNARGVFMARVARKFSTIPSRYEARWIISGSMPNAGRTMKVKL